MFSKLKHRLDRKSKRVVALLATAILLCGFTGCERSTIPDGSEISYSETGFDIERIRKNVIVDGQAIEIPIKLKELPKDWTYETSANRFAEDRCHVEVKDKNGDLLFSCGAENYKESKKGDSRIFDAPFENDKCSVDGITPFKTTREEIVERYGEATSIKNFNSKNMKAGRNIDMVLSRENLE